MKKTSAVREPELTQGLSSQEPGKRSVGAMMRAKGQLALVAMGVAGLVGASVVLASATGTPLADGSNVSARAVETSGAKVAVAQTSTRKPMRPVQFMNSIRRRVQILHMDSNIGTSENMNYQKARLTKSVLVMRGPCNPKNPYIPGMRTYRDSNRVFFQDSCDGYKTQDKHQSYIGNNGVISFTGQLNNLGRKGASSAGIAPKRVGVTREVVANKKVAVISYERAKDWAGRSIKRLKLIQKNRRRVVARKAWYPAK